MSTFVIVQGGWHTGAQFEATAAPLRAQGHTVYLPTLAGNRQVTRAPSGLSTRLSHWSTISRRTI